MHAPHSLREREQRAPAVRVAIFSPSVCLSAVGFVRLPRRPSAPRHQFDPQPPSACRGQVPESPGLAGPSCGPGPIVRRSVCPEAGPRDPERRGASRRRVKRLPTPLLGQAEDAGAPHHPLGLRLWVLLSACVWGGGRGLVLGLGGGGSPGSDPPPVRVSRDEAGLDWLPAGCSSFRPSATIGASTQPPSPRGPRSGWPRTAGTAPASDRLGRSWGRRRLGVGVQTRVSVPRRRLAEGLLNLDFGEDCVV